MTDISDITNAPFGRRMRHFLQQHTGKTTASPGLTGEDLDFAWRSAVEEMLDEVHAMLRALHEARGVTFRSADG